MSVCYRMRLKRTHRSVVALVRALASSAECRLDTLSPACCATLYIVIDLAMYGNLRQFAVPERPRKTDHYLPRSSSQIRVIKSKPQNLPEPRLDQGRYTGSKTRASSPSSAMMKCGIYLREQPATLASLFIRKGFYDRAHS